MSDCCRVEKPGERRGIVYVCVPADEKPYTKDELAQCEDFICKLSAKKEVSQDEHCSMFRPVMPYPSFTISDAERR